jgi:hypothetical protein
MHKIAAYVLLIGGFLWISVITVEWFDAPHRHAWVEQSEQLPGGDNVPREAAVAGLRNVQKSLDGYYSQLFIAGFLMLVGGVVNGINLRRKVTEQDGPANGSQPIRSETNRTSSAAGSGR